MAPPLPSTLPKVSFRIIEPSYDYLPGPSFSLSFNGKQANNLSKVLLDDFGYNPVLEKPYVRPEHYMRYIGELSGRQTNLAEAVLGEMRD